MSFMVDPPSKGPRQSDTACPAKKGDELTAFTSPLGARRSRLGLLSCCGGLHALP